MIDQTMNVKFERKTQADELILSAGGIGSGGIGSICVRPAPLLGPYADNMLICEHGKLLSEKSS